MARNKISPSDLTKLATSGLLAEARASAALDGCTHSGYVCVLPVPPSANRIWRSITVRGKARVLKSREYREWLGQAIAIARLAGDPVPIPVALHVRLCGVSRRGDLSNSLKAVEDCIRHAGIIPNDNLRCVVRIVMDYDPEPLPGGPGARVEVLPMVAPKRRC